MNYSAPHEMMRTADPDSHHKEKSYFDFSLGFEGKLSQSFAIQCGAFTNMSSATKQNASESINMLGASFGLSYVNKTGFSSVIGVIAQYGKSNKQDSDPAPNAPNTTASWKRYSVLFVIGGSYHFGN